MREKAVHLVECVLVRGAEVHDRVGFCDHDEYASTLGAFGEIPGDPQDGASSPAACLVQAYSLYSRVQAQHPGDLEVGSRDGSIRGRCEDHMCDLVAGLSPLLDSLDCSLVADLGNNFVRNFIACRQTVVPVSEKLRMSLEDFWS